MRRRSLVLLAATGVLAACSSKSSATPPAPARPVTADDYLWWAEETDLTKGFCFTWVRNLIPKNVLKRLGGKELERVSWQQLVGSGDGQRGPADRFFVGVCRVADWSLIVEDVGDLGVTDRLVLPLSFGTRLVAHQRDADGHGRFLLVEDGTVQLDFDPLVPYGSSALRGSRATELAPMLTQVGFGAHDDSSRSMRAAFALTERFTGVSMTPDLLRTRTYLLTTVPRAAA